MQIEFDHTASGRSSTSTYRFDWFQNGGATPIHSQNYLLTHTEAIGSTRYRTAAFPVTKPADTGGTFVVSVSAVNQAGASSPMASASFTMSAPEPVANVTIVDPML